MVQGNVPGSPSSPEEMQAFMERVAVLEDEMDAAGVFVFGGGLDRPDAASVARPDAEGSLLTDGPFAEAKEQLGGFYIIEAADLDEARTWAGRAATATNHPIEVRAFRATGKVRDHMGGGA
jgi:hypothetical protein